jgi:excinuclease ABC subunit C
MKAASCDMRYEDAARLRDAILRLRDLLKKQKAVSHFGGDHDAVAIASENGMVSACVLKVRAGILTDRKAYFSASTIGNDRELMREFLARYYTQTDDVPSRIFTTTPSDDLNDVVELINKKVSGGLLKISKPIRGEMKRLVVLAKTNAAEFLEHKKSRRGETEVLLNIGLKLGLGGAPELIDCVDISNLNGREAVGSVVSFRDGMPDKSRFRTYNIKTLHTPDDYAMMREVLTRRYGENISLPLPDLLLVDGGKGHLSVAMKVMKDGQIPLSLAAIAKGKKEGECDRIFIPNRKNPLNFKASSGELLFLMRIRDEAHRFGINAHRRMRSRKAIKT